jgi:hypothetical protein
MHQNPFYTHKRDEIVNESWSISTIVNLLLVHVLYICITWVIGLGHVKWEPQWTQLARSFRWLAVAGHLRRGLINFASPASFYCALPLLLLPHLLWSSCGVPIRLYRLHALAWAASGILPVQKLWLFSSIEHSEKIKKISCIPLLYILRNSWTCFIMCPYIFSLLQTQSTNTQSSTKLTRTPTFHHKTCTCMAVYNKVGNNFSGTYIVFWTLKRLWFESIIGHRHLTCSNNRCTLQPGRVWCTYIHLNPHVLEWNEI